MRLSIGTSGYSYKEWKGPFYPEKLAASKMLAYYAERLPAVEINNTFYRLPRAQVLETWSDQVPEDFRFSIKASRRITHFKRLRGADDETGYLLSTLETLGSRLGAVLFQLPPNLKCDVDRLASFLGLLAKGTRAAFEFRHESWHDDAVHGLLRERNFALCQSDSDDAPLEQVTSTADWGYLRLRRPGYTAGGLADWAGRVRETGWNEAFVFFKHEDEGAGPKMATEFLGLAGRPPLRKVASRRRSASETG